MIKLNMINILTNLNIKLQTIYFRHISKNIRKTKPLSYKIDKRLTIVTMLSHNTIDMYLIAIKSFMKQFGYGSIEVINDGSLTETDKEILNYHIPNIAISNSDEIDTLTCPGYISWKRLIRIAEIAKKSYVIQLDSDTISLSPLIEIHDMVTLNHGFLIGNNRWKNGVDLDFLNLIVKQWKENHVQPSTELILKDIKFLSGIKYLRGCAGFAGYPKNFASLSEIEDLSNQIEEIIGEKWHEWGSEQTATLCLISKTKNPKILPWPRYQNYKFPITNEPINSSTFVHFIGSNRHLDSSYAVLSKKFIQEDFKTPTTLKKTKQ